MSSGLILALLALVIAIIPERDELPQDCVKADLASTGRPVMFPPHDGLSMGISTIHPSVDMSDPIDIYVWVDNQADGEKSLMSCSMWFDWGIDVYDSKGHLLKTRLEEEKSRGSSGEYLPLCGRNILLHIPPHSCGPLQDMGDVKIDLRKERDLPPGNYFVTEKGHTPPLHGLQIVVQDKESKTVTRGQ